MGLLSVLTVGPEFWGAEGVPAGCGVGEHTEWIRNSERLQIFKFYTHNVNIFYNGHERLKSFLSNHITT